MWFNTYAEVKNAMYIVQFESSFEVHRYEVSSLHKLTEAMTGRPLEVNSVCATIANAVCRWAL